MPQWARHCCPGWQNTQGSAGVRAREGPLRHRVGKPLTSPSSGNAAFLALVDRCSLHAGGIGLEFIDDILEPSSPDPACTVGTSSAFTPKQA